jgi:hypothetical protein
MSCKDLKQDTTEEMVHWRSNIRISFKSLGTHQSVDQSIYQWPPKTCMFKLMVMTSRNGNKSLSNKNEGWPARWLFPCRNRVWDSLGVRRNLYMVTWRDFFHDQVCLMTSLSEECESHSKIQKKTRMLQTINSKCFIILNIRTFLQNNSKEFTEVK